MKHARMNGYSLAFLSYGGHYSFVQGLIWMYTVIVSLLKLKLNIQKILNVAMKKEEKKLSTNKNYYKI